MTATVLAVAAAGAFGGRRAAAAAPGTMVAWGDDADGQLGNGAAGGHITAGAVAGLPNVIQMDGGREHVVALRQNGTVWRGATTTTARSGTEPG
jgi:alpha-tubulin suppressor-like RCC1 family protein